MIGAERLRVPTNGTAYFSSRYIERDRSAVGAADLELHDAEQLCGLDDVGVFDALGIEPGVDLMERLEPDLRGFLDPAAMRLGDGVGSLFSPLHRCPGSEFGSKLSPGFTLRLPDIVPGLAASVILDGLPADAVARCDALERLVARDVFVPNGGPIDLPWNPGVFPWGTLRRRRSRRGGLALRHPRRTAGRCWRGSPGVRSARADPHGA